ncbi:MAG: hypothetical protein K0U40_03165 [Betaproteobacteria bacterium]|nr:hypothetical protein [Betaproteobacteria bacterium]
MKNTKFIHSAIILFTIITVSTSTVWARGGHSHFDIHIGSGFYGPGFYGGGFGGPGFYNGYGFDYPFFYPPPYYAYPPVIVAPTTPPVYVQQEHTVPVQPQTSYWYYCLDPDGYYPYIKECPNGWLQVVPQPR